MLQTDSWCLQRFYHKLGRLTARSLQERQPGTEARLYVRHVQVSEQLDSGISNMG